MSGGGDASDAELVLASTSRWRAELLGRLDLPFRSLAPRFDERGEDHRFADLGPAAYATHLARGKARSILAAHPELGSSWVLGCDQLAVLDEDEGPTLMHKPGSPARAVEQLMRLAGRSHRLVTAVVLTRASEGPGTFIEHAGVDEHRMHMRAFDRAEAEAYVARYAPIHSAGAYHIEDAGIRLFERFEGEDDTAIIGLPLLMTCKLLRAARLLPHP